MKLTALRTAALLLVMIALLAACAPAATPAPTSPAIILPATPTAEQPTATAAPTEAADPNAAYPSGENAYPAPTSTEESGSADPGAAAAGITYTLVPEKSEASYAVREQLANRDLPNDAVGTTKAVSGSMTIKPDGTIDSANSKFVVDLTSLQTDSSMRDNYVRRNVLQTSQYPEAVFVPTQISGLDSIPTSGEVSFQLTGDMTLHGVTKPVTWDVTGSVNGSEATGKATTSFQFADFNLTQPRVASVLSIVDEIRLEVNVTLQRSGG